MHGNYGANINSNECDVLIGVGMRFDDRVTGNVSKYARQAKVIHIDIDKAEINKIIRTDVAIHADAREALEALTTACESNQHTEWINSFHELGKVEHDKVKRHEFTGTGKLMMAEVIQQLSDLTRGEARSEEHTSELQSQR